MPPPTGNVQNSAAGKSPETPPPGQRAPKIPKLSGMVGQLQKALEEEAVANERHVPNVTECTTTFEPDYAKAGISGNAVVGLFKVKRRGTTAI